MTIKGDVIFKVNNLTQLDHSPHKSVQTQYPPVTNVCKQTINEKKNRKHENKAANNQPTQNDKKIKPLCAKELHTISNCGSVNEVCNKKTATPRNPGININLSIALNTEA